MLCRRCWYQFYSGNTKTAVADAALALAQSDLDEKARGYLGILLTLTGHNTALTPAERLARDQVQAVSGSEWPGPVLRYLRGELNRRELQAAASTTDEHLQMRLFTGWLDLTEGRREEGQASLQWVLNHGPSGGFEFRLARALVDSAHDPSP